MAASAEPRTAESTSLPRETSLLRWVWRAYVRNALVPLLVVELLLVAVYLTSHAWSLRKNVAALTDVARQELSRIAEDESAVIERQLGQVAALVEVLRRQTATALALPVPRTQDRARLRVQPTGALTTARDDGGAAVYWSARTDKGPAEFAKLERLAVVDPLLRDITLANPLIVQAYLNTHDSMTASGRGSTRPPCSIPDMNVPEFNFLLRSRRGPQPDSIGRLDRRLRRSRGQGLAGFRNRARLSRGFPRSGGRRRRHGRSHRRGRAQSGHTLAGIPAADRQVRARCSRFRRRANACST